MAADAELLAARKALAELTAKIDALEEAKVRISVQRDHRFRHRDR
jgi:hypothetical protein